MEVYGTKPKIFTKQWWPYFWEYYKIHTFAVLFLVFMFGSIIHSNVTRTKYDLHISYIGLQNFDENVQASINNMVEPVIDEINGNDKLDIDYMIYGIDNPDQDGVVDEYEYSMNIKISAELQVGDSYLYILSKANADDLYGLSDCFENAELLKADAKSEDLLYDENGRAWAVSLRNNPQFAAMGIDSSELYVAVRFVYTKEQKNEERIKAHDNSIKAARQLIGA